MKANRIGLIIDFDNTLVDTWGFVIKHIKNTCKKLGKAPPSRTAILEILKKNPPFEQIFKELFGDEYENVLASYREDALEIHYTATKGALELVKKLAESGAVVIIVSNRVRKMSERLAQAGFKKTWFNATMQAVKPKPDQKAYRDALAEMTRQNIGTNDTYVLGDSVDDYNACPKGIRDNFFAVTDLPDIKKNFINAGVSSKNVIKDLTKLDQQLFYGRN